LQGRSWSDGHQWLKSLQAYIKMTNKNKDYIDTSKDLIRKGIEDLLKQSLEELEKALNSKDSRENLNDVHIKSKKYNDVKKIAIEEGISTSEYDKRKKGLDQNYYKKVIRILG